MIVMLHGGAATGEGEVGRVTVSGLPEYQQMMLELAAEMGVQIANPEPRAAECGDRTPQARPSANGKARLVTVSVSGFRWCAPCSNDWRARSALASI
jgi:hypothetical protein